MESIEPQGLKRVGRKLVFTDMAIYTMVKINTFNGVHHHCPCEKQGSNALEIVRQFSYADFKNRLS